MEAPKVLALGHQARHILQESFDLEPDLHHLLKGQNPVSERLSNVSRMYFNRDGFHKSNSADFTNPISDGEAPSHWAVRTQAPPTALIFSSATREKNLEQAVMAVGS